jgi:hypothetical protein
LSFVTPLRVGLGGLGAAIIGGALAWHDYAESQKQVALGLSTTGRAAGATVADIENIAEASASSGKVTVGTARDIAVALAQTGQIGKDSFAGIIDITRTFAKATGQEIPAATKELAAAFAEPGKGAEDLAAKINALDGKTLQYIRTLDAQGDKQGAQKALLDATKNALADTEKQIQSTTAWYEKLWNAAKNAGNAIGKGVDQTFAPNLQEQLNSQLAERDRQLNISSVASRMGLPTGPVDTSDIDAKIAKTRELIDAENKLAEAKKKEEDIKRVTAKGDDVARGVFQEVAAYDELLKKITQLNQALEYKDRLGNPTAVQQASTNLQAQLKALNPVGPGNPDANAVALINQDYQMEAAAVRAVTVGQQAAAAAQIAYTQTVRAGRGEVVAMAEAEKARKLTLDQYQATLDKQIQEQQTAIDAQKAMNAAVESGQKTPVQAAQDLGGEIAHRQRLVEIASVEQQLQQTVAEKANAEGAAQEALAAKISDLTARKEKLIEADKKLSEGDAEAGAQKRIAAAQQLLMQMGQQAEDQALRLANVGADLMTKAVSQARLQAEHQIQNLGLRADNPDEAAYIQRIRDAAESLGRLKGAADIAEAALSIMQGQQADFENTSLELAKAQGMATDEYIRSKEAIKAEQQIRQAGIPAYSAQANAIRENAAALGDLKVELAEATGQVSKFASSLGVGNPLHDGSGKSVDSLTYEPNVYMHLALYQQINALNAIKASLSSGSSPADAIAKSLNSLLSNAQSNLKSAQQSAAANDNASDPNGSKTAPKLDAYAERNASIFYGTESGNYYSDAIQKSQSTQEQILSTNQDQLATAQAEYDALQKIAAMANQMAAQHQSPVVIAQAIAGALQQIGLGSSAQSMLDQAQQIKSQIMSASIDSQIAQMNAALTAPIGATVGGSVGGGGTLTGFSSSTPFGGTAAAIDNFSGATNFAGMFANGGAIPAGMVGIAGEKGPELITGPATVIPFDKSGKAGGGGVTQNINVTVYSSASDGAQLIKGIVSTASQNVDTRRVIGGSNAA